MITIHTSLKFGETLQESVTVRVLDVIINAITTNQHINHS